MKALTTPVEEEHKTQTNRTTTEFSKSMTNIGVKLDLLVGIVTSIAIVSVTQIPRNVNLNTFSLRTSR